MMTHRFQLVLDEDRYQKVTKEARRRGESVSAVIRDAIDLLPADLEERRAAIEAILSAEPMPVPWDPQDLRRELDEAHGRLPG